MLDYKQAIEAAKKVTDEYPVEEVLDFGDCYAVGFDLGEIPPPGLSSHVLVDKETGETEFLTVPPIENLERLETAPELWAAN